MIRKLFLIFVCMWLLCGCACAEAYATYDPDGYSSVSVPVKGLLKFFDGEINDPEYLATHIIWANNNSDVNLTNKIYWTNPTIFVPYGDGWKFTGVFRTWFYTGYYNYSDKVTYQDGDGYYNWIELAGSPSMPFIFSNSTIYSLTQVKYSGIYLSKLQNCYFDRLAMLQCAYLPVTFEICNITSNNQTEVWTNTLITTSPINSSYHDFWFTNCRGFFEVLNATNTTIYNVTAVGTIPDNQVTGVTFAGGWDKATRTSTAGGHDNRAWNISINSSSRSGFDLTYFEHDFYAENIKSNMSGHNNFDLHGQWNVTLKNITSYHCLMEGIMITTGNYGPNASAQISDLYIHNRSGSINERNLTTVSHNISLFNIDTGNSTGSDLSINRFIDVYIENVTSNDTNKFMTANFYENLTMINVTCLNQRYDETVTLGADYGTYKSEGYANDTKLIDMFMSGKGSARPYVRVLIARNVSFINYYADSMSKEGIVFYPGYNNDYTKYWYGDIHVVNATGSPVEDAIITANTSSRNGYGKVQSVYLTDSTGRLYDNGNRSNWMAIPEKFRNDSGIIYYTPEINVSSGEFTQSYVVDPDYRWYTRDSKNRTYTITAVLNSSSDLHFTGYSPSPEYNTFQNDSSVKMQVWTNKPLTNVVWKVDGVEKQNSTSTTYESTVGTAPITVDLIGSTATETISKSWVIDPTNVIEPEPDPEGTTPVAEFSANATTGNKGSVFAFTDNSTNSPTNWYWDFDNDGVVDSTSQNATARYAVAGNYTVKLTVSNANGPSTEIKTSYIQISGTALTKKRWYSPFVDWISLFRQYYQGA